MIFPPKRDWWVAILTRTASMLLIGASVGVPLLLLTNGADVIPLWPLFPLEFAAGCLLLWMYHGTSYEITPTELVVRCGPLGKRIALAQISEAVPTKGLYVGAEMSFAWSLDRVRIRYHKKNGRPAFLRIAIAPLQKYEFLLALAEAAPGLKAHDDGSLRRPREVEQTEMR